MVVGYRQLGGRFLSTIHQSAQRSICLSGTPLVDTIRTLRNLLGPPRILVTRSPHQASALADHLRALGAEPILIPTIELTEPTSFTPLDGALGHLERFHWLLFTSANAVEAFHRRLAHLELTMEDRPHHLKPVILSEGSHICEPQPKDLPPSPHPALPSVPFSPKIAAIGSTTAKALMAIGLTPTLIPSQAVAESMADALLPHALQPDGTPTRFLLIRAEEAREHLPETLRAAGSDVTVAPAYRTVIPADSVNLIRELFNSPEHYPDAITFTSASTARNLFALLEAADITLPRSSSEEVVVLASIGPITSTALHDLGYAPQIEAAEASVGSLAEILVKYLRVRKSL